jgi:hypothetical protein
MDKKQTNEVLKLLSEARSLIEEMGWSRQRYVERDRSGAPIAFNIMGALQYATVAGNYERSVYLAAKDALQKACMPLSMNSFNRLAHTSTAILARYEAAMAQFLPPTECKVIPFPLSRRK